MYDAEDYLLLSGIQHFAFCRRQWALIHVENIWDENLHTVEGHILHERAHDEKQSEKRGGLITTRNMAISSSTLGISGACDVVEFHESDNGIPLHGRRGKYQPVPIEYKKGKPKKHDADILQLCAQAMCLEEMLVCSIDKGYLFYGETRRRFDVEFTSELRQKVSEMVEEMHMLMDRNYTPKVKTGKYCTMCSLNNVCLPQFNTEKSVNKYISDRLGNMS